MNQERDQLISTINKTITEIKEIRDKLKTSKTQIDEIKVIRSKLYELEKALGPKKNWFAEKISSLNILLNELLVFKFKIISGSVDETYVGVWL